jgi:predicted phosphodiesterase
MRTLLVILVSMALGGCGRDEPSGSGGAGGAGGGVLGGRDGPGPVLPQPQADGDDVDIGHFEHLRVGLVGDTRPNVSGGVYPTQIITHIYQEMDARAPDFAVALGDYVYVSPSNLALATQQMMTYLGARASFHADVYYVVGNHEGYGDNLAAFRAVMSPAGYFSLHGTLGQATFKLVIIGDDLWTTAQDAWLKRTLSVATTYTFVCRHHPSYNTDSTEQLILSIIEAYPRTLLLDGHTHLYERASTREIVIGNGGAPLSNGSYYGYAILDLDPAGSATVTAYRENDDAQMESFSVAP